MEVDSLVKAREHAKTGKAFWKAKDYEKALKLFELSMQYYIEVLPSKIFCLLFESVTIYFRMNILGDLEPAVASAVKDECEEVLSRAESLKEFLHKGKDEHKAGTSSSK